MRPGNRPELPPLHAVAVMLMRIAVCVVVIGGGVIVASYFALGRPDSMFTGGAFPQLVSGARNLSSAVPTPDSTLASILRIAVTGAVIVLVLLIGAIGIWDAWQSRQRRSDGSMRDERGRPASGAANGLHPADAESLYSPEIARARARRSQRAPTDPDTLQGGTA